MGLASKTNPGNIATFSKIEAALTTDQLCYFYTTPIFRPRVTNLQFCSTANKTDCMTFLNSRYFNRYTPDQWQSILVRFSNLDELAVVAKSASARNASTQLFSNGSWRRRSAQQRQFTAFTHYSDIPEHYAETILTLQYNVLKSQSPVDLYHLLVMSRPQQNQRSCRRPFTPWCATL